MTLGAGPRGYADWQRIQNWDGPQLDHRTGTVNHGIVTTPIVQVDRYSHIEGQMSCGTNPVEMSFRWFADSAGTIHLAERRLALNPEIANPATLHLPNLGPWLQIFYIPAEVEAGEYTLTGTLIMTNRVYPLELVPLSSEVINSGHLFGGGGEVILWPVSYFAGPATLILFNSAAGAGFVDVQGDFGVNSWERTDRLVAPSGSLVVAKTILPLTAHRYSLNSGGAGSMELNVSASTTGSS